MAGLGADDRDARRSRGPRASAALPAWLRATRLRLPCPAAHSRGRRACRRCCDRRARQGSPAHDRPLSGLSGKHRHVPPSRVRRDAVAGHQVDQLAVEARHVPCRRRTARIARSSDRVEHRLHVRGDLADDPADLRRRRLPLERFLGLVEQAHVLDRDHRLVGEGLQQLDLLVGETGPARRGDGDARRSPRPRAASARASTRAVARPARDRSCSRRNPGRLARRRS